MITVDAPVSVGKFSCSVTISDSNADNSPQDASVSYTVSAGSCPTGNVSLTPTIITVGGVSIAAAPSGFSGGSFASDNTAVAAVSGATVTGEAQGSATISGKADWAYLPNGATGCSLGGAMVMVNFNHLTYQRTPQVDGQNVNDQATAVAVTAGGALRIMADTPAIPGSNYTTCGLALYDNAHNVLDSWSTSMPCLINQMALGPDGTTVYAAGWQQTDIKDTTTRSAMIWQVGLAGNTLNVLALADFQLPTTGPGMRTEAETINVQSGLLYVGTDSDYRLQQSPSGWYSVGGWMVVLSAANGVQQTYFEVGGYDPDINFTNSVTGVALFTDHLWTVSAGQLNGDPVHGWAEGAYSLTGTRLKSGEVETGSGPYNCRLFNSGNGNVLWGCAGYWSATNQAFAGFFNVDNTGWNWDGDQTFLFMWWGDNGNDANASSVNIATSSTLNPPGQGGLTMAGLCSKIGATDLTKTDACMVSFAFSGTPPAQKSWAMRLNEANTPGGSVSVWNDVTSYVDQQGVLHDVPVGTGSDGTTNCGGTPCTQAVIGDYTPPQ
jgi:hypothetical protein